MRATELLGSPVVEVTGHRCVRVRDLRVSRNAQQGARPDRTEFQVVGLVFGGGRLVHAWGFAEGRASGPWLLCLLTARRRPARPVLPADWVLDWGQRQVVLRGRLEDLPRLRDVVGP